MREGADARLRRFYYDVLGKSTLGQTGFRGTITIAGRKPNHQLWAYLAEHFSLSGTRLPLPTTQPVGRDQVLEGLFIK